jgi:uncharacterized iron-regulated protein
MMRLRACAPRRWSELLGGALLLMLCGCTTLPAAPGDRIYDVHAGRTIDRATLVARLSSVHYRLLGEAHDNPAHHRLRAELITALAQGGRHPAVVMEQFDLPYDDALVRAQAAGTTAEALASAGHLDRRGWRWPLHEPIVAAALAARLTVHAGNLARATLQPVLQGEPAQVLEADAQARLDAASWSADEQRTLEADITESHCGALPKDLVPRFARAERLRDAAMAQALVRDATADGAILVAGNGHVRRDRGVPVYLPAGSSLSVGFVEVAAAEDALAVARQASALYDYVWLTPEMTRADPCAALSRLPFSSPETFAILRHHRERA